MKKYLVPIVVLVFVIIVAGAYALSPYCNNGEPFNENNMET